MKYLLDENIFIQAHRFHYPLDVFPTFWNWLINENTKDAIYSISEIYDELKKGQDELWEWIEILDKQHWFLSIEEESTQSALTEIADWINQNVQFKKFARDDFLDVADPCLIAKAKTGEFTVVTEEKSAPKSKRKIHIPDVCNQFDIPYMNTVQMIRALGGRF